MTDLQTVYTVFDEDTRLTKTRASRIEYLTTMKYINMYLQDTSKILDIGAGTGIYSVCLAKQGFQVNALELMDKHVELMKEKIEDSMVLHVIQGNALNLSVYEDSSFDIVLCLGPLYHVSSIEEKRAVVKEAMRVCKQGGVLFFAYISNDMVIVTETMRDLKFLQSSTYDHETFKLQDLPFCFMSVEQMNELMNEFPIEFLHHIASDGVSELLADKINLMSDDQFDQWMKYHEYMCEKPSALSYSNHLLYIARKK